jgi:RimJ/RimL family protein N-acetyltransferase
MRVLEKAGFTREAVLRCAATKEGRLIDTVLYARVLPEVRP